MNKPYILEILMLLSALESWSFADKHQIPGYLLERVESVIGKLTDKVLDQSKFGECCAAMPLPDLRKVIGKIPTMDPATSNVLAAYGITELGQLAQCTEIDLLKTPDIGKRRLDKIRLIISAHGLEFGMSPIVLGYPPYDKTNLPSYMRKKETPQ